MEKSEEFSEKGDCKSPMSKTEIQAYAAGYNSAIRLFRGIIDCWAETGEFHKDCGCILCVTLRDVGRGRFGSMEINTNDNHSQHH